MLAVPVGASAISSEVITGNVGWQRSARAVPGFHDVCISHKAAHTCTRGILSGEGAHLNNQSADSFGGAHGEWKHFSKNLLLYANKVFSVHELWCHSVVESCDISTHIWGIKRSREPELWNCLLVQL